MSIFIIVAIFSLLAFLWILASSFIHSEKPPALQLSIMLLVFIISVFMIDPTILQQILSPAKG